MTVTERVSVEFTIHGKPPTKNAAEAKHTHWASVYRFKNKWVWRYMQALDDLDLDKPIRKVGKLYVYVEVDEKRRTRLETHNLVISPAISEPLLDALWRRKMTVGGARIVGGWISHDSDAEVELVSVTKSDRVGVEQTRVRLEWEPKECMQNA
jgi:hypothetical protein